MKLHYRQAKLAVMQIMEETENLSLLSLEKVARNLGLSARHMQKLLKDADTSYQFLLDVERRSRLDTLVNSNRLATFADAIAVTGFKSAQSYRAFCQRNGMA